MKNFKKKLFYSLIVTSSAILVFVFSFKLIDNTSGIAQKIKYFVPQQVRDVLRETIYKNQYLKINYNKLLDRFNMVFENDISFQKKELKLIALSEITSDKNQKFTLKKFSYPFYEHFTWGKKPPGYISEFKDTIISMSGSGHLLYFKKKELKKNIVNFNILNSNFHSFVNIEKYLQKNLYGIRDIEIINDEIFVSYVDHDSCEKLSILKGKINFEYIYFKKFFNWDGCVETYDQKTLIGQRSGGRIDLIDNDNILFSIGDYSKTYYPPEAQNLQSFYGSIIKINVKNKEHTLLSKGLRNPQGLYYDSINNNILITDHGPNGGDEINIQNLDEENFINFGWPKSSYGKHYKSTINKAETDGKLELLKKGAPLEKSHKKFGFKEPLKYWSPSIGISEVIKIPDSFNKEFINDYLIAAMGGVIAEGDMSLHQIRLSKEFDKIIYEDKIIIKERIRDLYYDNDLNAFILLLGTSPSIGVLNINTN